MPEVRPRLDPVHLLEALYDLEQPPELWFNRVLEAAGRTLDRGAGVGMLLYDVSGAVPRIEAIAGYNLPPEQVKIGAASHTQAGWAEGIVECYRSTVCGTLDEHVPDLEVREALRAMYAPVGIRDQLLINGVNHSGFGCALYVFSRRLIRLTSRERTVLTRIASHLSTAYRLQRRLAQPTVGQKALISSRWSLVDCYERNGQRYIVACENPPATPCLGMLSARELQVSSLAELGRSNKAIAYELDLAHSTVRVLLARAASKLGVRTRAELVAQLRALQRTAAEAARSVTLASRS